MASVQLSLTKGAWVQVTIESNDGSIRHQSGDTRVVYLESDSAPALFNELTPTMQSTSKGEAFPYYTVKDGEFVYAYAINSDAVIAVTPGGQYAGR